MSTNNEVKFENLQNVYLNSKPKTTCEMFVYVEKYNAWLYQGVVSIDKHVKRISTFVKYFNMQGSN